MSTPTIDTSTGAGPVPAHGHDDEIDTEFDTEFDLDIRIFESGVGLDEIIRMTDDNCGQTCESACNSC